MKKIILMLLFSCFSSVLLGQQKALMPHSVDRNPQTSGDRFYLQQQGETVALQGNELSDAYDTSQPRDVLISTKGGVEVTTNDGEFSFQFGGRVLIDAAVYSEDKNTLGNGSELRDIRFDLEGRFYADFIYELSIDFSDGEADIKDAWFAYDANYPWRYTIGHFKEPFSLEEMTSKKYLTFMERALPNTMVPGRSLGFGMNWVGGQTTFTAGLFGDDYNDDADDEGDEGWGATGRLTYAPLADERSVVHLGLAASYRKLDDEQEFRFDSRPESHLTDIRYLDTGKLNMSDSLTLFGLEGAWVSGSVSFQGEWIQALLVRDEHENPSFSGWYLQGSWFLTGESRHYKQRSGRFGRVRPLNDYGAVELAARYSTLDLNDAGIEGGSSDNITLGINWHLNPQIRLMANYIIVENDIFADADGDVIGEDEPALIQFRAQADF
ncbi:MAG: porin [Candidatus Thiodiazotropha sp. (ex Lucinoma annulata)]|nr:porin [Candidatus Thiodiazotropha sp. (ex Lucinoma borealis)]MCU7841310.1 porin [Candidatus Thiodiazotropha sp. (ex Troendleina suluensis)]MCU7866595.1 porin [Candidatus Thiodiazotropha sp. (ex Lucinoma borealis)]MCU7868351.1 porin [Candidatus Thiodiazotropha sp. (ex Lucinoma borealis)]MCU7883969.1 porin [Candidatus Thiodiazotropha sp. (ex Lucinoma annulata)]